MRRNREQSRYAETRRTRRSEIGKGKHMKTKTMTETEAAAYRVAIKRTLRAAGQIVTLDPPDSTEALERRFIALARQAPLVVADGVDRVVKQSKATWERGNNSGDATTLEECNVKSQELGEVVEQLMALFGVKTDWPGLYPSYTVKGGSHHHTISAIRAALEP